MTQRFTYLTKTQGDKEVILFDIKINGSFLVEVNSEYMQDKSKRYKFDTLEGATKKYESIKTRVAAQICG